MTASLQWDCAGLAGFIYLKRLLQKDRLKKSVARVEKSLFILNSRCCFMFYIIQTTSNICFVWITCTQCHNKHGCEPITMLISSKHFSVVLSHFYSSVFCWCCGFSSSLYYWRESQKERNSMTFLCTALNIYEKMFVGRNNVICHLCEPYDNVFQINRAKLRSMRFFVGRISTKSLSSFNKWVKIYLRQ